MMGFIKWMSALLLLGLSIQMTVPHALVETPAQEAEDLVHMILNAQKKLELLKQQNRFEASEKKVEAIAHHLLKKAAKEKDPSIVKLEIKAAKDIINNPIETVESIKFDLDKKKAARALLEAAKSEKDPKRQSELLNKAEQAILEFRTGLKQEVGSKGGPTEDEPIATLDLVNGLFGQELDHLARIVAAKLTNEGYQQTEAADRIRLFKQARNIMNKPKKYLRRYVIEEDIKRRVKKHVGKLSDQLQKETDPSKKNKIQAEIEKMNKTGVQVFQKMEKEEADKVILSARTRAKLLLKESQEEKNPKLSEQKFIEGKRLLQNPLDMMSNFIKEGQKRTAIQQSDPLCRKFVSGAMRLGRDELELVVHELKQEPKSSTEAKVKIVGLASTGTCISSQLKAIEDDFGVETAILDVSFTGWMKNNIEAEEKQGTAGHSQQPTAAKGKNLK